MRKEEGIWLLDHKNLQSHKLGVSQHQQCKKIRFGTKGLLGAGVLFGTIEPLEPVLKARECHKARCAGKEREIKWQVGNWVENERRHAF